MWTIGQDTEWEPLLEPPLLVQQKASRPPPRAGQSRPPIAILGIPFDSLTLAQTIASLEEMITSGRPHYLVTANVDFLVQARRDSELQRILLEADLVLCDGTPLVWASRWLGNPLPERVAGADLAPKFIETAAAKGYRLFFLGGQPEVTDQAVAKLRHQYPGLNIAGHFSPPFRPLDEMPHHEMLWRIRAAKPDVVFVSFGCPKAEKWMAMHYESLGVPVLIGVGGTIDFLAGNLKRAPLWMRHFGMEWLYRMLQEPRRLAGRYLRDLCQFTPAILDQWWRLHMRPCRARRTPPSSVVVREPTWRRIQVPERFDREAIARAAPIWEEEEGLRHCLVELGNNKFIDSTAISVLLRLEKKLRRNDRHLILLEPNDSVQAALEWMGLENHFLTADDILEARQVIRARSEKKHKQEQAQNLKLEAALREEAA